MAAPTREFMDGKWASLLTTRLQNEHDARILCRELIAALDAGSLPPAKADALAVTLRSFVLDGAGVRDLGAFIARAVLAARAGLKRWKVQAKRAGYTPPVGSVDSPIAQTKSARWYVANAVYSVLGGRTLEAAEVTENLVTGQGFDSINEFLQALGVAKASGDALRQAVRVARRTEPITWQEGLERWNEQENRRKAPVGKRKPQKSLPSLSRSPRLPLEARSAKKRSPEVAHGRSTKASRGSRRNPS